MKSFKNTRFYSFFYKVKNTFVSIYLCIRFPFLYPRNRFSGKHYTNWALSDKRGDVYRKWSDYAKEHKNEYYEKYGIDCLWFLCAESVLEVNEENMKKVIVKSDYVLKSATWIDRFKYWWYGFLNDFLGIFHCIPTYNELDAMPEGWRKRFGIQMCKELKHAILHSGGRRYMKDFRIEQIKEKYGTLRFYVSGETDEVSRVIAKYEYISQFVCVDCGEDAVKQTMGYICPYCEKCLPENYEWIWIDPVYGYSSLSKQKENEEKEKNMQ